MSVKSPSLHLLHLRTSCNRGPLPLERSDADPFHEALPLPGLVAALFALLLSVELTVPHYGILAASTSKAVVMMLLFGWLAWELMRRQGLRIWEVW